MSSEAQKKIGFTGGNHSNVHFSALPCVHEPQTVDHLSGKEQVTLVIHQYVIVQVHTLPQYVHAHVRITCL